LLAGPVVEMDDREQTTQKAIINFVSCVCERERRRHRRHAEEEEKLFFILFFFSKIHRLLFLLT
jgi:hypothetical protein